MSERDKQIEKERKGVVELLLKKNGLTRRQLVDDLVGIWAASSWTPMSLWAATAAMRGSRRMPTACS